MPNDPTDNERMTLIRQNMTPHPSLSDTEEAALLRRIFPELQFRYNAQLHSWGADVQKYENERTRLREEKANLGLEEKKARDRRRALLSKKKNILIIADNSYTPVSADSEKLQKTEPFEDDAELMKKKYKETDPDDVNIEILNFREYGGGGREALKKIIGRARDLFGDEPVMIQTIGHKGTTWGGVSGGEWAKLIAENNLNVSAFLQGGCGGDSCDIKGYSKSKEKFTKNLNEGLIRAGGVAIPTYTKAHRAWGSSQVFSQWEQKINDSNTREYVNWQDRWIDFTIPDETLFSKDGTTAIQTESVRYSKAAWPKMFLGKYSDRPDATTDTGTAYVAPEIDHDAEARAAHGDVPRDFFIGRNGVYNFDE